MSRLVEHRVRGARAVTTNKRYDKVWDLFWEFVGGNSGGSSEILAFIWWIEATGKGGQVEGVVSALKARFADKGWTFPVDPRIRQMVKAVKKAWRLEHTMKDRDPLGPWVARTWCLSDWKPLRPSFFLWIRDAVLVLLGLRCMLRPSELVDLVVEDVSFRHPQGSSEGDTWLFVRIKRSKTDQVGRGRTIPVEPLPEGEMAWCPVERMREYLEVRATITCQATNLFVSEKGKRLSAAAVSGIVRHMAEAVGFVGQVSGHSLRIGGACAAAEAGLGLEAIRAIGGWLSDSVFRYVRASATPHLGASSRMLSGQLRRQGKKISGRQVL